MQFNFAYFLGEVLIAEAQNVIMFNQMTDQKPGGHLYGVLSVTNFKFSFIRADSKHSDISNYQQNLLLGENEICLSAIDAVYQIVDRKRRLNPGQSVSSKVKGLQVVCKVNIAFFINFKCVQFVLYLAIVFSDVYFKGIFD